MGFSGSSGNGGSIAGASDTTLNNPQNNEVLSYNDVTSMWTNAAVNLDLWAVPIEIEYDGDDWPERPNTTKSVTWVSTKHSTAPLPPTQPTTSTGMAIGDRLIRHPEAA